MSRTSRRMLALGATLVCATGLAATATGVTSAYFSDTKSGTLTGTVGYVKVNVGGGNGTDGLDFAFQNLLPGEPQSITLDYKSTGTGTQDLWLTFPNQPALHALNNLGTYGTVTVTDSSSGVVFTSTNLNDGRTVAPNGADSCGPLAPTGGACWPLPAQLRVRSGLTPGAEGSVTFTFAYASKLGGNGPAVWNSYPSFPQAYGADAAGTPGNGLPYRVVATQAGQTP